MAGQPATYETGMRIVYDSASKKVTVTFRARITILEGSYNSEAEAINAGEMHCRQLGWHPETKATTGVSMMRRR